MNRSERMNPGAAAAGRQLCIDLEQLISYKSADIGETIDSDSDMKEHSECIRLQNLVDNYKKLKDSINRLDKQKSYVPTRDITRAALQPGIHGIEETNAMQDLLNRGYGHG